MAWRLAYPNPQGAVCAYDLASDGDDIADPVTLEPQPPPEYADAR